MLVICSALEANHGENDGDPNQWIWVKITSQSAKIHLPFWLIVDFSVGDM